MKKIILLMLISTQGFGQSLKNNPVKLQKIEVAKVIAKDSLSFQRCHVLRLKKGTLAYRRITFVNQKWYFDGVLIKL